MTRRSIAATIVMAVATGTGAFSARGEAVRQELIVPNVGIRGVKLGMSLAQVKRVLGSGGILNKRQKLGPRSEYVEYVWDYGSFRTGFVRRSGRTGVALVATTLSSQRTRSGIGVGTPLKRAQQRTGARCFDVDYYAKDQWYRDPSTESTQYCLIGSARGKRTVFIIGTKYHRSGPIPAKLPPIVREVIVREAF